MNKVRTIMLVVSMWEFEYCLYYARSRSVCLVFVRPRPQLQPENPYALGFQLPNSERPDIFDS